MRQRLVVANVVLMLLVCAPAHAQSDAELRRCEGTGASGEERVAACSRLIESGTLSNEELAAAYANRADAHMRLGLYDRSLQDHRDAVRYDPQPRTRFVRGAE